MRTPSRESQVWMALFLMGLLGLGWRALAIGNGRGYVRAEDYRFVDARPLLPQHAEAKAPVWVRVYPVRPPGVTTGPATGWQIIQPDAPPIRVPENHPAVAWTHHAPAVPREFGDPAVRFSPARTVGIWTAGFLTLFALSFLWGDNPFFKLMQALVVGTSAGYAVVIAFWSQLVPNLLGNLWPDLVRSWAVPGHSAAKPDWLYLVPLGLGIMMLWRLAPVGGWISRWPLAFFVGLMAGVNLVTVFKADFVQQIANTILPLVVIAPDRSFDPWGSLKNIAILVSVVSSLTYFFFSVEHKGAVGFVARIGVCVLMITFGFSFGFTVMTRITIFSSRLQFIFDDWLWLIDPLGNR